MTTLDPTPAVPTTLNCRDGWARAPRDIPPRRPPAPGHGGGSADPAGRVD